MAGNRHGTAATGAGNLSILDRILRKFNLRDRVPCWRVVIMPRMTTLTHCPSQANSDNYSVRQLRGDGLTLMKS